MSRKTNTASRFTLHASRSTIHGFTLTEVLVALLLLGVVIIAISNVEIGRGKLGKTTESLVVVQREATAALEHVQQRVMTAYYVWFDAAQPNAFWVQSIDATKVGEPPDPKLIYSPPDTNWPNFRYYAYALESGNLVFYENVIPGTTTTLPSPGPAKKRTIVCKNVSAWSLTSNDTVPADRFYYTGVLMQLGVTDPQTGKQFSVGPTELVSRSMGAARPSAWRPPRPPGTPPAL